MFWDIFCKVIDNHGDLGVCWRLAAELAARGERTRLWVDDPSALSWMAPRSAQDVEVVAWTAHAADDAVPGDVVIEAFGCELPQAFQRSIANKAAQGAQPVWINLEYLTAERFAERNHKLPSPVLTGAAAGCTKYFFYPGFTPRTGGLLRESDLERRRHAFDRSGWLARHGIAPAPDARLVSLFCYEPEMLGQLLHQFAGAKANVHLLVTAGRATAAVRAAVDKLGDSHPSWNSDARLVITELPLLPQPAFDELLWACELNFVRGEDSLVRALWAGKPMVWQAYPQHDDAHRAKLLAWLEWLDAPVAMREFHLTWNGFASRLPQLDIEGWQKCNLHARDRLLGQDDLVTQLNHFVHGLQNPKGAA